MKSRFTGILTLFLAFMIQFSFAQEKTITGTVTSTEYGALVGAAVTVDGTTRGTQTDENGRFSISAQQGEALSFSYVGHSTQTITVGASNVVTITLIADNIIDTIEVVGYTQVRRELRTASISVVKSEDIQNSAFTSFEQALQGRASGVVINTGSGQPGSSAKIRIRGTHSINGSNSPLIILDGIPIEDGVFASLNLNDFEDVTILKDAAATSMYGSRGAAGVIVLRSKKGTYGSETRFTYRSQFGITKIGENKYDMMDSYQLLKFQQENNLAGLGAGKTDEEIAILAQVNTNWQDVFFRTGYTQSHEISMSGGGDNTRFFNSLQYFEQEGVSKRSDLKRIAFRTNFENKFAENSFFGYNLSVNYSKMNRIDSEGSVTLQNPYAAAYLGSPYHAVYNDDGSIAVGGGRVGANAYENLLYNQNYRHQIKAVGGVYAEIQLAKNLTARADVGIDYTNNNAVRSARPWTETGLSQEIGGAGFYNESNIYYTKFNNIGRIVYSNTFADIHDVEVSGFVEYYKQIDRTNGFTGYGIQDQFFGYPGSITPGTTGNGLIPAVSGGIYERGLFSYFGIARYGYDSRFVADFSVRRDASSVFAKTNQWGTFWSASAAWNIHKESFMENTTWVNELKLRGAYGTSGNERGIPPFQEFATWGNTSYNGVPGIIQAASNNPDLKWEEGVKRNIALDFNLFDGRLYGVAEYYNNSTRRLFIDQTLPLEAGAPGGGVLNVNAGEMSNKGVDLQIEGTVWRNEARDINFNVFANFNYNKNRIESLGQVDEYEAGTSIVRTGLPFGSHFIVGWAGVNPANGEPLYYDLDGNVTNQYSEENSTANWGSYEPVYSGGFGTKFKIKKFDVSTLFTFMADYYRFNNQRFFQENPNFSQYNLSVRMLDAWSQPGDITDIQATQYNREFSSKDIEDASFLRFRNLQIGYTLDAKDLTKTGLSHVRFYLQGQNLYTWTKFTGFDPEDDNNIAQYEYPTPRIFTFGVDVNF